MATDPRRVLVVDLNNFARYPTVAIGYLVAVLRRAGVAVDVYSPLSSGVTGVVREAPPGRFGLLRDRVGYRTAVSTNPFVRRARAWAANRRGPQLAAQTEQVSAAFADRLREQKPDVVLISTYLMYHPLCERLTAQCKAVGVPVLIGGPYFFQPEVAAHWIGMDGLTGLVGGEVEDRLPEIVAAMAAGEDLNRFPGIWTRGTDGRPRWTPPPPLTDLDALPFPDYADFPWDRYPNRIVPLVTGRGAGGGRAAFARTSPARPGGRSARGARRTCWPRSPTNTPSTTRSCSRSSI